MFVETARVSLGWHPAVPQVSSATRRSPGFTNFTYSADSFSQRVYAPSGNTVRFLKNESFGCTCAFSFAAWYSAAFGEVPLATEMELFPPWQSVQPRCTPFDGCIVGSSVAVWQDMQPVDLAIAASCDCPRNGPCGSWPRTVCGKREQARKSSAKDAKTKNTISNRARPRSPPRAR